MQAAGVTLQKIKSLQNKIGGYNKLVQLYEDAVTLTAMAIESDDSDMLDEVRTEANAFMEQLSTMTLSALLTGKYDANNAILTLHAGAGGTEAMDWAEMLYRMYSKWADKRGYKLTVLDYLQGDEAGIKSVSFMIEGDNAYGYAKCERGVHRLVRISPFDSGGRRHTSFASLDVMPEITDVGADITINPADLRVDTYRSSGAGGQHVNKTDSAIRLTHIPTGIVVSCQTERSQHQNRDYAMKMLLSKLVEIKEREHYASLAEIKGEQREIAWGSQIRSYVFCPYTMVKDHRTGFEVGNVQSVMDGELDGFINAELKRGAGKSD